MQHTMAEEQIRLEMGFNLHQTTLKVEVTLQTLQEEDVTSTGTKHSGVYYKMFLFDMFQFKLFAKYG